MGIDRPLSLKLYEMSNYLDDLNLPLPEDLPKFSDKEPTTDKNYFSDMDNLLGDISDKELINMSEDVLDKLLSTGGGSYTLSIPAEATDTDIVLTELLDRFKASAKPKIEGSKYSLEDGSFNLKEYSKDLRKWIEIQDALKGNTSKSMKGAIRTHTYPVINTTMEKFEWNYPDVFLFLVDFLEWHQKNYLGLDKDTEESIDIATNFLEYLKQ